MGAWTLLSTRIKNRKTPKERGAQCSPTRWRKTMLGGGCLITWKSRGTTAFPLNSGVLTRILPTPQSQRASAEQEVTTLCHPPARLSLALRASCPQAVAPSFSILSHIPCPGGLGPRHGPRPAPGPSHKVPQPPVSLTLSPLNSQKARHLVKTRRQIMAK